MSSFHLDSAGHSSAAEPRSAARTGDSTIDETETARLNEDGLVGTDGAEVHSSRCGHDAERCGASDQGALQQPRAGRGSSSTIPAFQPAVALLLALGLVSAGLWYGLARGSDRMVDLDLVEPRAFRMTVDVNRASAAELAALPGVGPQLAAAIVRAREQQPCGFRDLEHLMESVSGVGPAKARQLRPCLLFVVDWPDSE